jgi:Ca2+-binding RTX toxin-like protein
MFRTLFQSFSQKPSRKRCTSEIASKHRRLECQQLERRDLMAVDVFYHDGFERGVAYPEREGIYIVGTSENDRVQVTESGGVTTVFAARPTGMGYYYLETSKVPNIHFYGGAGDDTFLNQSSAQAFVFGGEGNDTLEGGKGVCHVYGERGEDQIKAGPLSIAELYGGDGQDTIWGGSLGDKIDGGADLDVIYAGDGDDQVEDESGGCIVFGGAGNDNLIGGPGRDTFYGEDGEDYLGGNDGEDALFGGRDNDVLFGDNGRDSLEGGAGSDQVVGGDGDDTLFGFEYYLHFGGTPDNDVDLIIGGDGADNFFVRYVMQDGVLQSDLRSIDDLTDHEGDQTFSANLDTFTLTAYAASWAELYQGAGAAPLAGNMDAEMDWDIGSYDEQATWNELGPMAPIDEASELATLDDYFNNLVATDALVEGGNDILAIDAAFGDMDGADEMLDSSPFSYESGVSYLSAAALTNNSMWSSIRYSAF